MVVVELTRLDLPDETFDAILDEALPIIGWRIEPSSAGPLPVVGVRTDRRPDVSDLERVFRSEGAAGEIVTRWVLAPSPGHGGWAFLDVQLRAPVCCRFHLAFDARHDWALLQVLDVRRELAIRLSPRSRLRVPCGHTTVGAPELRALLQGELALAAAG